MTAVSRIKITNRQSIIVSTVGSVMAHLTGFEPVAFRLGVVARLFCGVMHNITQSEKSLYYGVFQGDAFRTVSRNIADFGWF